MSRKQAWIGAAVLAVVLGAAITVAVVVDYTDGARPGQAFADIGRIDSAHDAEVKLPIGTLKVQVGSPSQEYDTDYSETTRAADGAVLVPVGWEITGAQVAVSTSSTPVYQFQLTLVADGRRYDLQAGHEEKPLSDYVPIVASGSVAAVVEGEGENLRLEVEYDGLTQVVDVDSGRVDPGLAAPYYAKGGLPTLTTGEGCTALSRADQKTFLAPLDQCRLGPVTLAPYVGGYGWVHSKSESWATVPYSFQVSSIRTSRGFADYALTLRRFDVTLDGAAPKADILRYRNGSSVLISGVKVFRTSKAPTSLGVATEIVGDSRFNGSGTRVFRNEQTLPLR